MEILLINVKMSAIVCILIFMGMINGRFDDLNMKIPLILAVLIIMMKINMPS